MNVRLPFFVRLLLVALLLGSEWCLVAPGAEKSETDQPGQASATLTSGDTFELLPLALRARGNVLPEVDTSAPLPQDDDFAADSVIYVVSLAKHSHASAALGDCAALLGQSLQLQQVRLQL